MAIPEIDQRSPEQRERDERIAVEPKIPPLQIPADASTSPVETFLGMNSSRPVAVVGIVENGLVRPVDPTVKLPEHSQVIIVASEQC